MPWSDARHPLWKWLLAACAVATAAPLVLHRYLPFTDLPQHAAMMGTLRHWADAQWSAPYELALGSTQYVLYYLAGALLALPLGSAENGNLALLVLTALALPYSLRALLRAMRADERLALFAPAMFWNESLIIGFFSYLAALPILLWALALALREAELHERRASIGLAVLSAALFYLHLSAFLYFALCAGLAFLALPLNLPLSLRVKSLPRRLLWVLPTALLGLVWLATSPVVHPASIGWNAKVEPSWQQPIEALMGLPGTLMDIWRGPQDEWCFLALVALLAVASWPQEREPDLPVTRRMRGIVLAWALASAALYFATPVAYGWLWALNHRYAISTLLLLPALVRLPRGWRGALPVFGAACAALFAAGVAQRNLTQFDREVGPFDAVLDKAEPGKRLLYLCWDRGSSVANFAPFLHFGSYYRARKGGIAEFSFSELPQSPLRYKPGVVPPRRPPRWEWMPDVFRNDRDGPFYDYILTRGAGNPFGRSADGPLWRVAAQEGPWRLYARQ